MNHSDEKPNGKVFTPRKFLIMSWTGDSGDLAWQLKKDGHEVKIHIAITEYHDVLDGFIDKVDDWRSWKDWADVIIFDFVYNGRAADNLRHEGKLVVGGSIYTDMLESNREFGQEEMKAVGMTVLPHWNFVDFDLAIQHIKDNPDRYVFKPSGEASEQKAILFIGQEEDGKDIIEVLEHNKKSWSKKMKQFMLQKFASGVEIAVGAFFNGNDFIYPININFEHKKLFPGDIGPYTGEMGCYDDQTEVLTDKGWKFFKNVLRSDKICTLNPTNDAIEYHKPQKIVSFNHHKELVSIQNQTLDINVTLDHNMYVCSQNDFRNGKNNFKFVKARELEYQSVIKRTADWRGKEEKYFILPAVAKDKCKGRENSCNPETSKKILMDSWISFMGIWLSDGSVSKNRVCICQKIEGKTKKIKKMLSNLPFEFKEAGDIFYIYNKQLAEYLRPFGKSFEKYIPFFIKNLSKRQIKLFLEWYCLGDGTIMKNNFRIFYTSSKKIANDIQELLLKAGKVGIIKQREPRGRVWICDHYANSKRTQYEIIERVKKKDSWIDKRDIKKIKYSGTVYCATVKNHIMFVRRNGKPYWCGNTLMFWAEPNPLFRATLERMRDKLKENKYVGYIDINCIVNSKGIYPLEFTSRFGYPTISIQIEGVSSNWGDFLYAIAKGEDFRLKTQNGFQIGVVIAVPPFPYNDRHQLNIYKDISILFKKPNLDGVHLGYVKLVDNDWHLAGESGHALVITGSDNTVEEARRQTYRRVKNIMLQNMFYRTDIGTRWIHDSDKLQTWGYL